MLDITRFIVLSCVMLENTQTALNLNPYEEEDTLSVIRDRVKHYQRNPLDWIVDIFGDNIRDEINMLTGVQVTTRTGLTTQQENFMQCLGDLIGAKLDRHFRRELTTYQLSIVDKIGISIQAAQGVGKDFIGALAMIFMLCNFPELKGLATANTAKQLRNVYWAELAKIMRLSKKIDPTDDKSPTLLQSFIVWQAEKIYWRTEGGKEWFAEAVVTAATQSTDEQASALAGRHEKFMFFVVDEASGVPDGVMNPLEGTLTGIINLILLIFNPTSTKGYAIRSQREDSRYMRLVWSAEDSEIVPQSKIDADAAAHGRASNYFRIRCLGLPPLVEEDSLIPWSWIERAVEAWENDELKPEDDDPVLVGMDPAAGGDHAVAISRKGPRVGEIKRSHSKDTMVLATVYAQFLDEQEYDYGFIDNIGLGLGVYDKLRELGYRVFPVDIRRTSEMIEGETKKFNRLRDEIYWRLRRAFEEGRIAIPRNIILMTQLSDIKWYPGSGTDIKVENKKDMKARGLASPDEMDALAHTYYKEDRVFKRRKNKKSGNSLSFKKVYLR